MSYNIFMLCYYDDTIILNIKNNITYNDESNVLLNAILGMSLEDIKQVTCQGFGWNYNDVDVDITWRFHVEETSIFFHFDFKLCEFWDYNWIVRPKWIEHDRVVSG